MANAAASGVVSAWEAAVAASASKVSYTGAGTAIGGAMSSSDMVAIAGLALALISSVVNWHYKRKHFQLAERESDARLAERGIYDQG